MNPRHRHRLPENAFLLLCLWLFAGVAGLSAHAPLTTLEYRVVGQQLVVSPAAVAVPKGIPGSVLTTVAGDLPPGAFVEATLRGPSFPARRLVAAPNEPLMLPPLNLVGDYSLDAIRLIDPATGDAILRGSPSSVPVRVFDEVLISRVTSRPLTLDEIQERGIQIDEANYRAVEFEVGFVIDGETIPVRFPVVAPAFRQSTEIIPAAELEERLAEVERINTEISRSVRLPPALEVANVNIELKGINFQAVDEDEQDLELRIPPIPALMVIPGNIGFLNQFFSVMIFTENGAPTGSGLSVRDITAELILPAGPDRVPGTWENPGDDPLRFARVGENGIVQPIQPIVRPGPDGILGTADDIPRLHPGQVGQAEFLVEGLQEGLHVMDLKLRATLDGLAAGSVRITGKAAGSVLVRNPRFSMAFTHPRTVRVGEPYEAYVTVLNTSNTPANLVNVTLNRNNVSGGILESPETVELGTILPGETAMATFRIRSQRTGSITFSNLTTSDDSLVGRFRLRAGVDERGVALSPATLLLPDFVDELPSALELAAQRVLGQALSSSTAGQVPPGVTRVPRPFLLQKAVELAEAGQRVRYGEDLARVLPDLLLDWQGARDFNAGWDQILRTTDAGREWRAALMLAMESAAPGENAVERLAAAMPDLAGRGEQWIVAASSLGEGTAFELIGAGDKRATLDRSALEQSAGYPGEAGAAVFAKAEGTLRWRFETAAAETFEIGIWKIDTDGTATEHRFTVPGVAAGACLSLDTTDPGAGLRMSLNCGSSADATYSTTPTVVQELPPTVLAVRQDPEVLVGRPPKACISFFTTNEAGEFLPIQNYGNIVAVLFSKPMTQSTANVPEAYVLDDGNAAAFVQVQPGGRVALLTLKKPVGGLIPRTLFVGDAVTDVRGNAMTGGGTPLDSRLVEGINARGRVIRADGSPAADVPVTLTFYDEVETFDGCTDWIRRISQVRTNAAGEFDFDFILGGIRYTLSATDTSGLSPEAVEIILESTREDAVNRARLEELADSPSVRDTLLAQFAVGALPQAIALAEGLDRALVRDRITLGSPRFGTEAVFALRFRGRGTVTGQVLAADGTTPVAGAAVNLFPAPDSRELGRGILADADGRFAFFGVPLGVFTVEATSPAGRTRTLSETLDFPGHTRDLDVVLSETVTVLTTMRGRVTEPDGTPHASADVYIGRFHPDGRYVGIVASTRSGPDGYWAAEAVPVGTYDPLALSSDGRRRGDRRNVQAVAGAATTANITLQARAIVTGRVETSTGLPVPNALVGGGETLVRTDELGRFTLTGVPTGNRRIEAAVERDVDAGIDFPRLGSVQVNVIGGADNFAVVRLTPAGRIIGRVLDTTGEPVPRARVAIPQDNGFLWVQADPLGNYEFVGLWLDTYDLSSPAPPTEEPFDASAAIDALLSGSQDEMLTAIGEAFAAFTGVNNPLLNGDGSVFNPLSWGFESNVRLQFDGQTVVADIRHLGEGTVSGTVLNGQGVPIGARVRLTGIGPSLTGRPIMMIRGERDSDPAIGTFEFPGQALVGDWGLQAASPFFPVVISTSGRTTSLEPDATGVTLQFPPVQETNGSLAGQVFHPDGSPAGADIDVQISFGPDFIIRTDENGRFATQAGTFLLPAGNYTVTATDPDSGATGRANVTVPAGQTGEVDVRLLGRGEGRVRVVRADGTPGVGASVEIRGGQYPRERFEGTTDADGWVTFSNIFEGPYAASVELVVGLTRLSGRGGFTVSLGGVGERTVSLGGTASLRGTFVATDGVTPVSFANIALGDLAFTATDVNGQFEFDDVPLGSFRLVGTDAVTGRTGSVNLTFSTVNEVRTITLVETSLGEVIGYVVNGYGTGYVPNATVTLRHNDSFFPDRTVTTGPDGAFRFPGTPAGGFLLSARDPVTNVTGNISGVLPPLTPQLSRNVPLPALADLVVRVFEPDGVTPAALASVRVLPNLTVDTDEEGRARFDRLRLDGGIRTIIAESLEVGFTRRWAGGRVALAGQGSEESLELVLRGVGQVTGQVFLAGGTPAGGAEVRLRVGSEPVVTPTGTLSKPFAGATEIVIADGEGRFTFSNVPAGDFRLTAVFLALAGSVNSTLVTDGATVVEDILLSDSGTVVGRVLRADGFTPVQGTDVLLTYPSLSGLPGRANTLTDANGFFSVQNVPVGAVNGEFFNAAVGGLAFRSFSISENNETFDLGDVFLDEEFPEILTVDPEDTAEDIDIFTTVEILFSEPLDPASIHTSGIFLRPAAGGPVVAAELELLDDEDGFPDSLIRLTPDEPLESEATYEVIVVDGDLLNAVGAVVNRGPRDLVGRSLTTLFKSTFTTRDQRPPELLSFTPEDGAEQIDPRAVIRLTFDEPVRPDATITLVGPGGPVPGTVSLGVNALVLTFVPEVELPANATFTATVDNVADIAGNFAEDLPFVSTFATLDTIGPEIAELRLKDGAAPIAGAPVTLEVVLTAPDPGARVRYSVDFTPLGSTEPDVLEFTHTLPASGTIVFRAIAIDRFGNEGEVAELPVTIVPNVPPTVSLTRLQPESGPVGTGNTVLVRVEALHSGGVAELRAAMGGAAIVPLQVTDGDPIQLQATVSPSAGPAAAINIVAVATDITGETSGEQTFTIPIFDNTSPTVTLAAPAANTLFEAGQALNLTVVAGDNFGVTRLDWSVTGAFAASGEVDVPAQPGNHPRVVSIPIPAGTPNDGEPFTVSVQAFDAAGLSSNQPSRTFRMFDRVPPRLVEISPADGSENVPPLGAAWTLAFDKDLDPVTVAADTFTVVDGVGDLLPFTLTVTDPRSFRIQPEDQPLEAETTYTLSVAPALADLSGNVWIDTDWGTVPAEGLAFSFTTGTAASIEPRTGDPIVPGQSITARLFIAPDSGVTAATFAFNDDDPVSRTVPAGSTVVEQRLDLPVDATDAILHVTATIAGEVVEFAPVVLAVRPREADDSGDGLPNGWKVDNGLDPFVHDADDPVLFTDDFEEGAYTAEFWYDPDNRWHRTNGTYARNPANSTSFNFSTVATTAGLTDFDLTVDMLGARDGGIVLRSDARADNAVVFIFRPNNADAYFITRTNGAWGAIVGQVTGLSGLGGADFRINIQVRGNRFDASVAHLQSPDVELFSTAMDGNAASANLRGGHVGLYSFNSTAGERFDHFEVRLPAESLGIPIDREADGLTHLEQFELATDPRALDTDGDGLADGAEVWGKYQALGWWRGEATTTDVFRRYPGAIQNGPLSYAEGARGRAFAFDGGPGRIQILNSGNGSLRLNGEALTLEAWVHQNDATQAGNGDDAQTIFDKFSDGSTPSGYLLDLVNGRPRLLVATADHAEGISVLSTVAVPLNEWVHLAGVYDGTALRLYVDGSEFATTPATGALLPNNLAAAIGNDNGGSTGYGFKGRIDEVAVYGHALPAEHIAELASLQRDGRVFALDPLDPDTDGDGIPDGIDPFPLQPNRPPIPGEPVFTANSGLPQTLFEADILADASDPDGDAILLTGAFEQPANGTVTLSESARTFTYTSDGGFSGEDSFTYTLADEWGLIATGTIVINVDANRPPIAGVEDPFSALRFVGGDGRITLPNGLIHGSTQISVEVWFQAQPGSGGGVLFGYQGSAYPSGAGGWVPMLYLGTDGRLRGEYWFNSIDPITSETDLRDGEWHHAVLVGAGDTQSLWLNGELVGTRSGAINHISMVHNQIGAGVTSSWPATGSSTFEGSIYSVRIWHRPLDSSEIGSAFDQPLTVDPLDLVAWYASAAGIDPEVLDDVSGNGRHGVFAGTGQQRPQRQSLERLDRFRSIVERGTEGQALLVTLEGVDPDGDPLTAIVRSLPANGTLFQFSDGAIGDAITTVPTVATDPAQRIVYVSGEGFSRTDSFLYSVDDGQAESSPALALLQFSPAFSPTSEDVWDIARGSVVTSHSGVRPDSLPGNMFGGSGGVEPLNTLFAEDRPEGFTHFVEWQTPDITWLEGFNLFASDDSSVSGNRGITEMRLFGRLDESADFELIATHSVPANPYFPDNQLRLQGVLAEPFIGRQFRVEFDQFGEGVNSGPRIEELDAIGWRAAPSLSFTGDLLPLQNATSDNTQSGFSPSAMIDGIVGGPGTTNGWAGATNLGTISITAVVETVEDVIVDTSDGFVFELIQPYGSEHFLGRFRLSATTDSRDTFADGLAIGGNITADWTVLDVLGIESTGGETFTVLEDSSILVSGNMPATTTYRVLATGITGAVTGFRLEALEHPSLPSNGPGRVAHGNWVLSEFRAYLGDRDVFNRYPVAADLFFDATAGEPLFLSATDLFESAFDPDGGPLELVFSDFGEPATGLLEIASDGSGVTYTAPVGFGGIDSFTYTVRDSSGLSDTATVFIDVDFNRAPVARSLLDGYALAFNGSGGEVDLGNPPELQMTGDQTIEMWLRPTDFDQRRNPWAKAYAGEGTITQEMDGRLNYFYGNQGNNSGANGVDYQSFSSIVSLPLDQWTHVAVVRDLTNGVLRWYFNGNLVSEADTIFPAAVAGSLPAYIGRGYVQGYAGELDEVRVWNLARTPEEIAADYMRSLEGTEVGLAGYWRFDEGSGSQVMDTSPNDLTGTLGGGANAPLFVPSFVPFEAIPVATAEAPAALLLDGTDADDDPLTTFITQWPQHGVLFTTSDGVTTEAPLVGAGNALLFEHNRQAVELPHELLNGQGTVTFEFWARTPLTRGQALVSGANASNDNNFLIWLPNPNQIQFYTGQTNVAFVSFDLSDADLAEWNHYAFVRDVAAQTVEFYLNGESRGAESTALSPLNIAHGGLWLAQEQDSVGGGWSSQENFVGRLDEVRVWAHARSAAEIAADWNRPLAGNETGLRGYYPMDTDGDTLLDRSGNAFHGLLASIDPARDASMPSVVLSSAPLHGGLPFEVGPSEETVLYQPEERHQGIDYLGFRVFDGSVFSEEAIHPVWTTRPLLPPFAIDVALVAQGGVSTVLDPFFNDYHPEGIAFSVEDFTAPENGQVTFDGERFVYTPDAGFAGFDTFTYRLSDGERISDSATVTLEVTAPDEIRWINPDGGNFMTASNWSADRVPGPGERAVIDLAGTYVVTINANHTVGQVFVGGASGTQTLRITGNTFAVQSGGTITEDGRLELTGGALNRSGILTVHGDFLWSGGNIEGQGTLQLNGLSTFAGTTIRRFNGPIENAGMFEYTGDNLRFGVTTGQTNTFRNLPGATFTITGGGTINQWSAGTHRFENAGLFIRSGGGSTTIAGVVFDNTGTLEIGDGANLSLQTVAHRLREEGSVTGAGRLIADSGSLVLEHNIGRLRVSGATASFPRGITISELEHFSGTLSRGSNITVTVADTFVWSGGNIAGQGTLRLDGLSTFPGNSIRRFNGLIENAGSFEYSGDNFRFGETTGHTNTFHNLPGSTFTVTDGGSINQWSAGTHRFLNDGAVVWTSGAAMSVASVSFDNQGSMDLPVGAHLTFNGALDSTGTITTDENSRLIFQTSIHHLRAEGELTGPVLIVADSGTTRLSVNHPRLRVSGGTLHLLVDTDATELDLFSGTLSRGEGVTVTVSDTFVWSGGNIAGQGTLRLNGTSAFSGTTIRRFNGLIENAGSFEYSGDNFRFGETTGQSNTFHNLPGATFTITDGGTINQWSSGTHRFENAGDFIRGAGASTTIASVVFDNTGTVEIGDGANITLQSVAHRLREGGLVTGPGGLIADSGSLNLEHNLDRLRVSGATVAFTRDLTIGDLEFVSGTLSRGEGITVTVAETFVWSGGSVTGAGTLRLNGTTNYPGTSNRPFNGLIENAGTFEFSGSALRFGASSGQTNTFRNLAGGTFTVTGGGGLEQWFSGTHRFENAGAFIRSPGGSTAITAVHFQNDGLLVINGATFTLNGGFTQNVAGALIQLADGTLGSASVLSLGAGALTGTGTVAAHFINAGILRPEPAPGGLTFTGNLTQSAAGRLELSLGPGHETTGHRSLTVAGALAVDGSLALHLLPGFDESEDAEFAIIGFASTTGGFAQLQGFADNQGYSFDLLTGEDTFDLIVLTRGSVPAPDSGPATAHEAGLRLQPMDDGSLAVHYGEEGADGTVSPQGIRDPADFEYSLDLETWHPVDAILLEHAPGVLRLQRPAGARALFIRARR